MLNNGVGLMLVEETLGGLFAFGIGLLVLRRMGATQAYQASCRIGLPVIAAVFLITPYLPQDLFGIVWQEGVACVRECCIALVGVLAWSALAGAARAANISASLLGSVGCAIAGVCAFAGLSALRAFGPPAAPLGAFFLVLYLAALALASACAGHGQHGARATEHEAFERYLQGRVAALACEHKLSPREKETLLYLSRGHSYVFIAERLCVSESTARTHVRNIFRKIGVNSREELLGLVDER